VALATPVEPLQQNPYGAVEELFQAGGVPVDSVVVVRPTQFGVPPLEEHWQPEGAILLAPRCEALPRGAEFLAGRAALERILPLAVLAPSTLKPQTLEPDVAPALFQEALVAPPVEVAEPIALLTVCLLRDSRWCSRYVVPFLHRHPEFVTIDK
jgi:hypothetical protein